MLLKKFGTPVIAVVLIVAAFAGGMYVGGKRSFAVVDTTTGVINKDIGQPESVDFALFWKAWNVLNDKYVPTKTGTTTKNVTDEERVWGAIQGLAASFGDPYTVFFPPAESKAFQAEISGQLEGVGMEVGLRDGVITVIAPLKGTPAERAGIRAGDKILKINDTVTVNMTVDQAVNIIRGKKGTEVRITVLSTDDQEPRELKITRDVINIPTLDTEKRKDGIFVIKLYNFSANASGLFRNAMREFLQSGSNKLIIDLRGNPGGYLDAAVDMASFFLPDGKVIVQEDTGGKGQNVSYTSRGYNIFSKSPKVVILVDNGSASASEILAGALREHGIATLVGTKTYGKGSVQELVNLTSDTSLKVTIARWLTPNGNSISEVGLTPDVEVKRTAEDVQKGKDPQMDKAVEILSK